jgi:hypothetical protein
MIFPVAGSHISTLPPSGMMTAMTQTKPGPEEWRFHTRAETANPPGFIFVSEKLRFNDETLNIPAPSVPALFLSAAVRARDLALPHLADLGSLGPPVLFDCLEALASAVVFSCTAVEAFANDRLPDVFSYVFRRKDRPDVVLDRIGVEKRVPLSEKLDRKTMRVRSRRGYEFGPSGRIGIGSRTR